MIHIRDTFDTSRETGNQAPCSHIRYCSVSTLFTITKWEEICFSFPAPFPLRMATLIDFVLLYTKVEAKNIHDKLTGSLGIFIMAITAILPVWGLSLNLVRARALEAFLFWVSKASYFLKKKKKRKEKSFNWDLQNTPRKDVERQSTWRLLGK